MKCKMIIFSPPHRIKDQNKVLIVIYSLLKDKYDSIHEINTCEKNRNKFKPAFFVGTGSPNPLGVNNEVIKESGKSVKGKSKVS